MSISENQSAADRAGGHWLHLEKRAAEVKGKWHSVIVAVCVCGWESIPQRLDFLAVEAGCDHSNAHQPGVRWHRDEAGRPAGFTE